MTDLLSPATFEFFARNLLAGYVIILVRSRFIRGVRPKPAELVVEAVILSLLNQAVLMLLRFAAGFGPGIPGLPNLPADADLTFEVVVLPALVGLILGWHPSRGGENAFLRLLSMPVIHPVQRAYASDPERSNIYLERLYSEDVSGQWQEMSPRRSAILSLKGVRSIEFLDPQASRQPNVSGGRVSAGR